MYANLIISVSEKGKIILDMYNTTVKPTKKSLFRKHNQKVKIDIVMTSYQLNKEQARQFIDILDDALEELENPEDKDSDEEECY